MSAIILRDEIIHYEVLGRGRPLLFLHAWVGSWRYWIPSMQAASIGFRSYALDFWGFGDTAKNPAYYSIEQQLGLVGEFMDSLGIAKIALVGHGLGAIVAALYAIRHPDHIDRLFAISLPSAETNLHPRLRNAPPTELADWLLSRNPATQAAWDEAPKADPRTIPLALASLSAVDLPFIPLRLHTPSLFVHGDNDPLLPPADPETIAADPAHTHRITLAGCGHFPMLDEPSKFNRLLVDFLSLPSGESPRSLQLKDEWKRRVR